MKSYNNQRYHALLSWPEAMPALEALAACAPEARPPEVGDLHDPTPWLEAFDAGVGSPLELAFLRLFEKHGLELEKQVSIAPEVGGRPISAADFVVKGTRVAIYVDGAAFHRGDRLRRDRRIRDRLRAGAAAWRIVELRASDLGRVDAVIERLRAASRAE